MKKSILLGVFGVLALSFGSCKKDWNCTCEFTLAGTRQTTASPLNDVSRGDAHDACDALETTTRNVDPNAECEIGD